MGPGSPNVLSIFWTWENDFEWGSGDTGPGGNLEIRMKKHSPALGLEGPREQVVFVVQGLF